MDGSPYGMEDDMMGDMDDYGQEGEEGDPMDGSGQYGQEGEYGDENVSYNINAISNAIVAGWRGNGLLSRSTVPRTPSTG